MKAFTAAMLAGASAQMMSFTTDELKEMVAPDYDVQQLQDIVDGKTEIAGDAVPSTFSHPTICDSSVNQTTGYIKAASGPTAPHYFFWLAESKSDPANDPLLMWLSGGPGCSSQLALFAENGPCKVNADGNSTTLNPYSWNAKANVMWVDQPAGVGFTTGLGTHNEAGVASNMYTFLQGFYEKFPQYQKTPFYIFGESYAGHYVPAISHKIWENNKASEGIHIPLTGIAIGNGLTNPEEQYKWYAEMGHSGGVPQGGHAPSVYGDAVYNGMKALEPACTAAIKACAALPNPLTCLAASEGCNLVFQIPYRLTGKNPYDMRIKCEHGNLCYDFDAVGKYLNSAAVKQELGVKNHWGSCNMGVNLLFQLAGDWMQPFHTMIPDMLHDGIDVLIYAGDVDYICNWLGNKAWTLGLDWEKKDEFNAAEDKEWQVDGKTAARLRTAGNFNFMQVYEAGHMVPMDKPAESLEMVNAFISKSLSANVKPNGIVV